MPQININGSNNTVNINPPAEPASLWSRYKWVVELLIMIAGAYFQALN